jgi:hypothetical protein
VKYKYIVDTSFEPDRLLGMLKCIHFKCTISVLTEPVELVENAEITTKCLTFSFESVELNLGMLKSNLNARYLGLAEQWSWWEMHNLLARYLNF